MTFTLPHQQIFIETSIFTDFFLSVYLLDTVDIFSKICALKKIYIRKDLSQNGSKYWIFGRNWFEKIWESRRVRNIFGRYRFQKDLRQQNVSKYTYLEDIDSGKIWDSRMVRNIFGRLSSTKMASSILIFYNTVNRRTNPFFHQTWEKNSVLVIQLNLFLIWIRKEHILTKQKIFGNLIKFIF